MNFFTEKKMHPALRAFLVFAGSKFSLTSGSKYPHTNRQPGRGLILPTSQDPVTASSDDRTAHSAASPREMV